MTQQEPTTNADAQLVGVKIPLWMKKVAAQIGAVTGEDIGEVLQRLAGESLVRDHAEKQAAFQKSINSRFDLGGEGG